MMKQQKIVKAIRLFCFEKRTMGNSGVSQANYSEMPVIIRHIEVNKVKVQVRKTFQEQKDDCIIIVSMITETHNTFASFRASFHLILSQNCEQYLLSTRKNMYSTYKLQFYEWTFR